jgi:hypothetical protein
MRLCINCAMLQDRLDRIMGGLEGVCMTCEPVGHRNLNMEKDLQQLKATIERLTEDLKVMTDEHRLACEDRDLMICERDEARRSLCRVESALRTVTMEEYIRKELGELAELIPVEPERVARERGWDCFQQEGGK